MYALCMSSKTINITLPEELVKKIDKAAKGEFASRSVFIRETLVRRIKGQRIVDEWGDTLGEWDEGIDLRNKQGQGMSADKIKKFLNKLITKELARVREALQCIARGDLGVLEVKSLKGKPGYIRVRVGSIRIICRLVGDKYEVLHITNRNEKTYRGI